MQIEKFSVPTKFDMAPYGTVWKSLGDGENYELWIQACRDQFDPQWIKMGSFLERVYKDKFTDEKWLNEILKLY